MSSINEAAGVASVEETTAVEISPEEQKFDIGRVLMVSFGHFFDDCYPAFLGPLLPLLIAKLGISIGLAGLLATIQTMSTSLAQPVYGQIADRINSRIFVPLGILIATVFFSIMGLAPNYVSLVIIVIIGGAGVALFHPTAAVMAGHYSGSKKSVGVSLFVSIGTFGYAAGPMLIVLAVAVVGLEGSFIVALPGIIMAFLLYKFAPKKWKKHAEASATARKEEGSGLRTSFKPLATVVAVVILNSGAMTAFTTFVPTYLEARGYDLIQAGAAVSAFVFFGAAGTLLAGYLHERVGLRTILAFTLLLSPPLLFLFLNTNGIVAIIMLAAAGFLMQAPQPLFVVFAQGLVPRSANTASGLVMGFSWGIGGLILTPLGFAADQIGLPLALTIITVLPILAFVISLFLPKQAGRKVAAA